MPISNCDADQKELFYAFIFMFCLPGEPNKNEEVYDEEDHGGIFQQDRENGADG
jgi:hypothetical protein